MKTFKISSLGGSLELELGVHHGLDTTVHVLDKVLLGSAQSTAVGDVEDAIAGVRVLTTGAADLDVPLVGDTLESGPVSHEVGEVDMHGGTKGSSEVGGA